MTRQELELLLDLILNKAEPKDLEVVQEALKRRMSDLNRVGHLNFDPRQMSQRLAADIQNQLGATRETVHQVARDMVEKMIRQQVPDIPEEHLKALLAEWVPNEAEKARRGPSKPAPIPPDVLTVMIRDFIAFATGAMTAHRQVMLNDEIPNWQEVYWTRFPERVQKLTHLVLEKKITVEVFWQEVKRTLAQPD